MRGIEDVELFFALNGFPDFGGGKWEDCPLRQQRSSINQSPHWNDRSAISRLYRELALLNTLPKEGDAFCSFRILHPFLHTRAGKELGRAIFRKSGGAEFTFKNCPDFARYLCGGWLEEYVYLLLEPQFKAGVAH